MNIYWPIYLNIESEVNKLMYAIHMSDDNKRVYSSIISDLILRCSAEIESLAKELYRTNGGTKIENLKYDYDCLKFFDQRWSLGSKKVFLTSVNCFFSNREIIPFKKTVNRTGTEKLTYLWNNAYQNLKHDRAKSLEHGNVEALFEILAALFILNVYNSNQKFELGKNENSYKLDRTLGSSIFSVMLYHPSQISQDRSYYKSSDFDSYIYIKIPEPVSYNEFIDAIVEHTEKSKQIAQRKLAESLETLAMLTQEEQKKLVDEIKSSSTGEAFKTVGLKIYQAQNNVTYSAELNKNQV